MKAMSSLLLLVCHLYKVRVVTGPARVNTRTPGSEDSALLTLFSGGEAGGVHRCSGQTEQKLLLNTAKATLTPRASNKN